MTKLPKEEKYCLIVKNDKAPFEEIHKRVKTLGGFYDGLGWSLPLQYKEVAAGICEDAGLKMIIRPLESNFDSFRRLNVKGYNTDRLAKLGIEIYSLKNRLQLSHIADDELPRAELENISEGKELLKLIGDKKRCNDKIARVETEERLRENREKYSYSNIFEINSLETLRNELQEISANIPTGYTIAGESLKIPGGALTIVAAPTSHGKTAFLINMSLGIIRHNHKKNVFFFTYEEARASIQTLYINTFLPGECSKNSRESVREYLRTGDLNSIKKDHRDGFEANIQSFEDIYFKKGRLRVIYEDMPIESLIEAIKHIRERDPEAVIFIDYVQFLKSENGGRSRQEELKDVCLQLKDCTVATGLPIILAAQFNRTVICEGDLSPVAIGEAGDIERAANMIIGFWNRNFEGFSKEGNKDKQGRRISRESTLYVEILKRRGGIANISEVFDFDGNKGLITNKQTTPNNLIKTFGVK